MTASSSQEISKCFDSDSISRRDTLILLNRLFTTLIQNLFLQKFARNFTRLTAPLQSITHKLYNIGNIHKFSCFNQMADSLPPATKLIAIK